MGDQVPSCMTAGDGSVPWTRRALLAAAEQALTEAGIPSPRRNSEWMMTHALGCMRTTLYAYPEVSVPQAQVQQIRAMVQRRIAREPLQYILGETSFYGLTLQVTPAVLIPRPETEQVVEAALALLKAHPAPRILDAGTGSGCIALALKQSHPGAHVWACDVSPEALALARSNADALGLEVDFSEGDILGPAFVSAAPEALDLIISNPPYVPDAEAPELAPEVRDHEPHLALFTGGGPLRYYHALAHHAQTLLAPQGWLVLEVHADYGEAVAACLTDHGLAEVACQPDLAGLPRIVTGRKR